MATFGNAADMEDGNDVLEGLRFWRGRARCFSHEGDAEAAEQALAAAEEFRIEAEQRGLI